MDIEGAFSALSLERYGEYMLEHTIDSAGEERESDNWQAGFPLASYVKSLLRHSLALWRIHRGFMDLGSKFLEDTLCAIIFNAQGYLHVHLKGHPGKDCQENCWHNQSKEEVLEGSSYRNASDGFLPGDAAADLASLGIPTRKMDSNCVPPVGVSESEYHGKCDCGSPEKPQSRWNLACCDYHCFNCTDHHAEYEEERINNPRSGYPSKG